MSTDNSQHSQSLWLAALPAILAVPVLYCLWQLAEAIATGALAGHGHWFGHLFFMEFVATFFISCVLSLVVGLPLVFWFRARGTLTRSRVYACGSLLGLLAGVGYAVVAATVLAGALHFSAFMLITWGLGGLVLGLASGVCFNLPAGIPDRSMERRARVASWRRL